MSAHCTRGSTARSHTKPLVAEDEIAASKVHAVVAQKRRTTRIFEMIETTLSISLDRATESVAGVGGQRLIPKCADLDMYRTVLG